MTSPANPGKVHTYDNNKYAVLHEIAHAYIQYLEEAYGWDYVLQLLRTEDYESVFGKSAREIYEEWVIYISNNCIQNHEATDSYRIELDYYLV